MYSRLSLSNSLPRQGAKLKETWGGRQFIHYTTHFVTAIPVKSLKYSIHSRHFCVCKKNCSICFLYIELSAKFSQHLKVAYRRREFALQEMKDLAPDAWNIFCYDSTKRDLKEFWLIPYEFDRLPRLKYLRTLVAERDYQQGGTQPRWLRFCKERMQNYDVSVCRQNKICNWRILCEISAN